MMMALKNPNILGPGISGTQGAMIMQHDGSFVPNTKVEVDDEATIAKKEADMQAAENDAFTDDVATDFDANSAAPAKEEEEK